MARNVLGGELEPCSFEPLTGFYRDGCCESGGDDDGVHTVCVVMTGEFLEFSRAHGNDLSTPDAGARVPRARPGRPLVPLRVALAGGLRGGHGARRSSSRRRTRARSSGARSPRCRPTRPRPDEHRRRARRTTERDGRVRVRVEPGPKRVRAYLGGTAVVDSTHVRLVWEQPAYPTYYFPLADVRTDLLHADRRDAPITEPG